jgi:alkyl hydroperoxide reductase subunit AhpF
MASGDFWMTVMDRTGTEAQPKRIGAVRAALLFGTAAIALAAILTPIAADRTSSTRTAWSPDPFDKITTGSIPTGSNSRVYTVRKSILQDAPGSLCIIRSDGSTSGDC